MRAQRKRCSAIGEKRLIKGGHAQSVQAVDLPVHDRRRRALSRQEKTIPRTRTARLHALLRDPGGPPPKGLAPVRGGGGGRKAYVTAAIAAGG